MRIGLDLSVIQTPHRMRGIGATAINFVNNLSDELKQRHSFEIFLYEKGQDEALQLLDLNGLDYQVQYLLEIKPVRLKVPGRLNIINGLINNLRKVLSIFSGDPRIKNLEGIDAFLQFDQMAPLPKSRHVKTALILYDIIPYVMETDYLWTYKTARNHGDSRKSALRKQVHRYLYKFKTRTIAKSADVLIAISSHTKNDFVTYLEIKPNRINVIHLGIALQPTTSGGSPKFKHFIENSWGYFPKPISLGDKPFLLYVGGADPRRRLNDLVAAFNNLRAQGQELRLVFAGDSMKGPHAIPITETRKYIASSSYIEDIAFLGFVDEYQKAWLYNNAVAFIYPSVYEGFGLPILEAMQYGCPVITYKNSSITEIANGNVLYAIGSEGIYKNIIELLNNPEQKDQMVNHALQHVKNYTWDKTAAAILELF